MAKARRVLSPLDSGRWRLAEAGPDISVPVEVPDGNRVWLLGLLDDVVAERFDAAFGSAGDQATATADKGGDAP